MSIDDYDGNTFVAYIDISGFKKLMQRNKALDALDAFYNAGYRILQGQQSRNNRVEGFFVSDCGILFVNNRPDCNVLDSRNLVPCLGSILQIIREINEAMREKGFMLTTSVAYGQFIYRERIEFPGIDKTPIYGGAYVTAFLDNENGVPKIQPGQCRIVAKNLPGSIVGNIQRRNHDAILGMVTEVGKKHWYYYWMLDTPEKIKSFERNYRIACNVKYKAILALLKDAPLKLS